MLIYEPRTPYAVSTPHGDGEAFLIVDYGVNVNSVWYVRLAGGHVKHYYSDDIKMYGNPMNGLGWDMDAPPRRPEPAG